MLVTGDWCGTGLTGAVPIQSQPPTHAQFNNIAVLRVSMLWLYSTSMTRIWYVLVSNSVVFIRYVLSSPSGMPF